MPVVEQQIMIGKIRDLEAQIAESRLNTAPAKSLDPSKFILQIPGITENYKQHLDFGKVKVLSNRNALEYKGRILKPHEKAELTDKIVTSRDRFPVLYEEGDRLTSTAISDELVLCLLTHPCL